MVHRASVHGGKAWRQGLALWLLLLSIFTHVAVPTGDPLQRIPGSAFSATTAEVAIAPDRKTVGTGQEPSGDERGSNGGGSGDHPPLVPVAGALPLIAPVRRAAPIVGQARLPEGGAAPFSARAPPSV